MSFLGLSDAELLLAQQIIAAAGGASEGVIQAVDAWIHSGGSEERQVYAARLAEHAAADAYQAVVDATTKP